MSYDDRAEGHGFRGGDKAMDVLEFIEGAIGTYLEDSSREVYNFYGDDKVYRVTIVVEEEK